jgi:membrane-associated phospholipid phosphatase
MRKPQDGIHRRFPSADVRFFHVCCFWVVLAVFWCQQSSIAQTNDGPGPGLWNRLSGDISVVMTDAAGFFSAPLHFGSCDWGGAGIGFGIIALAATQDEAIRKIARRNRPSGTSSTALSIGRHFGSMMDAQIFSAAVYAVGFFGDDDGLRLTGRMLTEGLVLAGATRFIVGVAVGRNRPFTGRDPWTFVPAGWKEERNSFPSAHAAGACVVSTILSDRIGHPVATGLLFAMAAVTGASRLSDDQHWFSDVVAGSALGILAGRYVISRERTRKKSSSDDGSGLHVIPSPDRLTLRYDF